MGLGQMGRQVRELPHPDAEWVDAATVTPEEWLEWLSLTHYSGCFSKAVLESGVLYLKSYTGFWFKVCGVRITDEVLIDHTPRLQQISQD